MPSIETADQIAASRRVSAEAVLEGRADLSRYPFQLLTVQTVRGTGVERVAYAASAAEFLMRYGWELVNIGNFTGSNVVCAVMRRPRPV